MIPLTLNSNYGFSLTGTNFGLNNIGLNATATSSGTVPKIEKVVGYSTQPITLDTTNGSQPAKNDLIFGIEKKYIIIASFLLFLFLFKKGRK